MLKARAATRLLVLLALALPVAVTPVATAVNGWKPADNTLSPAEPASSTPGKLAGAQWPGFEGCPDLVLLVARGSGESPQSPDDNPLLVESYNADTAWGQGMPGEITAGVAQGAANRKGLTSVRQGVVYPALPVEELATGKFFDSIDRGADAIVAAIKERFYDDCGRESFQIIGYSQGAWAVRIAMRRLSAWIDRQFNGEWPMGNGQQPFISGIALLGDPTFDSRESIVRWDPERGRDLGIAIHTRITGRVPKGWFAPYPRVIRDRVSSYCLSDDLVCRSPKRWQDLVVRTLALKLSKNLEGHLSYGAETADRAGRWLAKHLPALPSFGTETGRVSFRHPSWGPATLISSFRVDYDDGAGQGFIRVVDADGRTRWRAQTAGPWYLMELNTPAIDSAGNMFVNWDPGRENGVTVLRPKPGGMADFGTLAENGEYRVRFYWAHVVDVEGDGVFEVAKHDCDSYPHCEPRDEIWRWDGTDFVLATVAP